MTQADRRRFLKGIAAMTAAGTLPASIGRALALPANRRTGSIRDVEHVVILMQENRSFDHYFGTLAGVRGYGDPRPVQLKTGKSVFHQPTPNGAGEVLPFHMETATTSGQLIKSLDHSWKADGAEWADYACWIKHKTPMTMGYFRREDVPFYHALADAFTIGDGYYASIHGPTNPNRMFLFTGTSGLSVGDARAQAVSNADDGNWSGDAARDKPDFAAAEWTTYAERLQHAGVSWKLYQEFDNFGDNSLAFFKAFRGLDPSHHLYQRGRAIVPGSTEANAPHSEAQHLIDAFAADVAAGRLAQVTYLVAPTKFSEHPEAPPALGESFTSRILDALTARPEVWAKTALIINYDENDGFFDHMPGPQPAIRPAMGKSTVATRGEEYQGGAVGLGVRVPLLVVSPWSRGGWVNSQVFDHTSVIRFLEQRFGVAEPNISPWRRMVTGDLTGMFDFATPDASALHSLPDAGAGVAAMRASATRPAPVVPASQALPGQMPGRRPARALPYALQVHEAPAATPGLSLAFVNQGTAGAVFGVYPLVGSAGPWFYSVGAGERVSDTLPGLAATGRYGVAVHGPNGFLREFAGDFAAGPSPLRVELAQAGGGDTILVQLANPGTATVAVAVTPLAYRSDAAERIVLAPGERRVLRYPVAETDHWYDFAVATGDGVWRRRFAGHVETGRPSRSDPAIATLTAA